MPLKIEEIFAYVGVDDDGNESVAELQIPGCWVPLVATDWDRVQSLKPLASQIAKAAGRPMKLVKFRERIEVEDITS